ncbi:MAG: hypothetical protein MRY78_06420 [Saprospiraceae bacterium]|nr:hypothetical protein [Saprospiraceae bacterium]
MTVSVEISQYPLTQDYVGHILNFIERLKKHTELSVSSNHLSTQVFGEYAIVMDALKTEMETSFLQHPDTVIVVKFIGKDARNI